MRRYLVPDELQLHTHLKISGDIFHHIHVVCRQEVGDKFELLNAKQEDAFLAEVVHVDKQSMIVSLLEARRLPSLQKPYLHLVLNFPKPKVFEAILEKAVELGVHSIHPVLSDFSFFKDPSRVEGKPSRWDKIIQSAMQQSGRYQKLQLHPVTRLADFLAQQQPSQGDSKATSDLWMAFYEGEAQPLHHFFADLATPSAGQLENIWIFVGSEGGFSQAEVRKFKEMGVASLSLGDQVLRVETACVSIVAILKYVYGCGSEECQI